MEIYTLASQAHNNLDVPDNEYHLPIMTGFAMGVRWIYHSAILPAIYNS
jgi:hypothetical protein